MKLKRALPFVLLIVSCAPNTQNSDNTKLSCPAAAQIPYHELSVLTEESLPEKVAVELEGEIKYDECLGERVIPPPPIVTANRTDGGLKITVRHYGAYEQLPADVSFKVFDRGNCATQDLFYSAFNVELDFQKVYPNGPKCGSNTFAKAVVYKP